MILQERNKNDLIAQDTWDSVEEAKTSWGYEENVVRVVMNGCSAAQSVIHGFPPITSMFTALNASVQDIAGVTDNASGDLSDVQKTLEDSVNLLKDASDKAYHL
ncbi:MAG: hypothetical protein ACLTDC_08905 [Lachnospiraceae bacterium]